MTATLSDQPAPLEYEYSFPKGQDVLDYNFKIEYNHAGLYEDFIDNIRNNGYMVTPFKIDYNRFMALLNAGLLRIVHVETSEEDAYLLCKFWCSLEQRYKVYAMLDSVDLNVFYEDAKRVWSTN